MKLTKISHVDLCFPTCKETLALRRSLTALAGSGAAKTPSAAQEVAKCGSKTGCTTRNTPKAAPPAATAAPTTARAPTASAKTDVSQSPTRPASATPSTPRRMGATGPTGRAVSSSPLRTPRQREPKSLFEVAQPLLEPHTSKEKRALALGALSRCLREGASPHRWDGPETPLRAAVGAQSSEMARLLIHARADPNEKDAKGVCVLHSASFDGLTDLCQTLLKGRADANAADQHGQTAFFFAPSSSVCDILLEHKANVNAVNQKGQSPLHLASRAGLSEVLMWFAPRISREIVDLRDIHGATAAYYARHAGVSADFLTKHKLSTIDAASEPATSSRRGARLEEDKGRPRWESARPPLPPLLERDH
eukprot:g13100.t1